MINQRNEQNLERALTDLVDIGRMWASHGLTVGKMALQSSATTLGIAADALAQLAADFAAEEPAEGTEATEQAAQVVIDAPTPDNLATSAPGCDNQLDDADAQSSRPSS